MGNLGAALRRMAEQRDAEHVQLLETHISWVLLADEFAWKLKKPIDLEFADFSTLDRREQFCHEELRLNRRLSPELYLDVVPVTGTAEEPLLEGKGTPIDFAVKMRRFAQAQLLSHVLERNQLTAENIDGLAETLADFHHQIAVAGGESDFGTPASIDAAIRANFDYLDEHLENGNRCENLQAIDDQTRQRWKSLAGLCKARQQGGFVRECHGDLHLGNMVLLNNRVRVFDAIDFNAELRWIDVMNEIAFVVMDLQRRGRRDLAFRLLNRYCELTGDYSGVRLLRFYVAYRALVRAKVRTIRGEQQGSDSKTDAEDLLEVDRLLQLAASATRRQSPVLLITCGYSGCGKSTLTQALLERIGAVRMRSDVERKRLLEQGEPGAELYSEAATDRTYDHLAERADELLDAGLPVVVDATFLQKVHRDRFERLAERQQARFAVLSLQAPVEILRSRIEARHRVGTDASDADLAVLQQQIETQPLPTSKSDPSVIVLDATRDPQILVESICERLLLDVT